MKLNKQDWQKLQTPLVILGSVIITVTLLFGFAQYYNTNQKQALQTQKNLLNAARQRYQSSGTEKDMITEFLPQYQALISQGFVGEERRIEWVDDLRAQHKNHKLFGIKYNISQQEKYTPVFARNLGGFVLHRSVMKLELDMLHEGDLLQLTESLNANNAASFMLRDCEIVRLNTNGTPSNQLIANLHAQCELDWLTLREPAPIQTAAIP
ncbi:MAG: hypothetical protein A3I83_07645 [Methylotenera sp. RIFCSPLOWO2_02_FULL_45_14]|nr:MAG: hypothetical protein A3I83_07645 [Methylotenera sp. RIFCSPLOWO2_02_FULL_45_14]